MGLERHNFDNPIFKSLGVISTVDNLLSDEVMTVTSRLLVAVLIGAMIGVERAYHGRPAGLRTHTLVCLSSSLLMLLTVFQWDLLKHMPIDTIRVDPTRMAQGIMTGIGFLGAGVIMKERFSIRGLTTAASVWITASIGIMVGMGFYFAAMFATFLTLLVLSIFGWAEHRFPYRRYAKLVVKMKSRQMMTQDELLSLVTEFNMKGGLPSYQLEDDGRYLEYRMTVHTTDPLNFQKLANNLNSMDNVHEFSVMPTTD